LPTNTQKNKEKRVPDEEKQDNIEGRNAVELEGKTPVATGKLRKIERKESESENESDPLKRDAPSEPLTKDSRSGVLKVIEQKKRFLLLHLHLFVGLVPHFSPSLVPYHSKKKTIPLRDVFASGGSDHIGEGVSAWD